MSDFLLVSSFYNGSMLLKLDADKPGASVVWKSKARGEGLIHGAPTRVAEDVAAIEKLGLGGIIGTFRLGPMAHEVAAESLTLFLEKVAPQFRG